MKTPMRRYERQIHDPEIISAMLDMIDTVYLGMNDGDYPYVVPVSFGHQIKDGKLHVYVHCAREGHKVALWEKNPKVSLTFSIFFNHPDIRFRGLIHDYRSVMAHGVIRKLDPEKGEGAYTGEAMRILLAHYDRGARAYSAPHCRWSDMYEIVCEWDDVVGKSERELATVEDVPFDLVYNTEDPGAPDNSEFFVKKYM